MKKKKCFPLILCCPLAFYLVSCAGSVKTEPVMPYEPPEITLKTEQASAAEPDKPSALTLTFAGDIMAHTPNFRMKNYRLIYADIESIIKNDDFSFANFETPVHAGRPYENYPNFNVQPPYADAAIAAGFDVFSLANNHTNDQESDGVAQTYAYFKTKESSGVYAAGIKEKPGAGISYQVIRKNDWTILYAAVTEILNRHTSKDRIDYVEPAAARRETFRTELQTLRSENPCDVFVLSIHTCEDEYVPDITTVRRNYYYSLIDSGVDIIWANHPHIAKEWEIVTRSETAGETGTETAGAGTTESGTADAAKNPAPSALVMYALGNTISGQRYAPDLANPANERDNTGDGYLIQVRLEKERPSDSSTSESAEPEERVPQPAPSFRIADVTPYLITTYIDPARNYVIKQLNDTFIENLAAEGKTAYAAYFAARKEIMENIKGTYTQR